MPGRRFIVRYLDAGKKAILKSLFVELVHDHSSGLRFEEIYLFLHNDLLSPE